MWAVVGCSAVRMPRAMVMATTAITAARTTVLSRTTRLLVGGLLASRLARRSLNAVVVDIRLPSVRFAATVILMVLVDAGEATVARAAAGVGIATRPHDVASFATRC